MRRLLVVLVSLISVIWCFSLASNFTSEQQEAYNYAYSQWITTALSIEKANMDGQLTRIAMAKMISNFAVNVLWLQPDTSKNCSFTDVSASLDAQYNYWVTQVCQLWLMWIWDDWKKSDNFNPYGTITRAQFVTAFSRALSKAYWETVKNWDPYYSTHLQYLYLKWIIKNVDTPYNIEKRWNVMIMMQRASKINKQEVADAKDIKNTNNNITNYDWILWVETLDTDTSNKLQIKITNNTKSAIQIDGLHLSSVKSDKSVWVYQWDNTMQPEYLSKNSDNTIDVNFWYPAVLNKWESIVVVISAEVEWGYAVLDGILFSIKNNEYSFSKNTSSKTDRNGLVVKNDWNIIWEKDWTVKTYYNNWQLHEILNYKDGKLNWEYVEYFGDWSVASKWNYKDWELDGYWVWYCEKWDTQCGLMEWNYKDWKLVSWVEGYWTFNSVSYWSNKQVQSAAFYDSEWVLNWDYVSFYENWQLKEKGQYKDNKKTWEWVEYFEDWSVASKWSYKDWELDGYWVWYCEKWDTQCISLDGNYKYWKLVFEVEEYWTFNSATYWSNWRMQSASFTDGEWVLNWDYVSFYENWQLKEKGQYKDNKKTWEWVEYFEDWSVASKWSYKDWELDGYWVWYCEKWDTQCTSLDGNYKNWERIWG